jgi:hypothetical protein
MLKLSENARRGKPDKLLGRYDYGEKLKGIPNTP